MISSGDLKDPSPNVPSVNAREVLAWAFYDFANSGYTTVVLTTVYGTYFVAVIAGGLEQDSPGLPTLLWTIAIALANLCVLISAPVIGAIADYRACKKRFLMFSTVMCVLGTVLLGFAMPGEIALAMTLLVLSTIAFASGENLIAAFLPEIARGDNMGRISGYGWSLGYFGGLLTLGICLAYITSAGEQGQTASDYVPVTLWITAVIFAFAAVPTFVWLRERAQPKILVSGWTLVRQGLLEVRDTLAHAARYQDLFRFLLCLTAYQAGVATVIVVAAIYAQDVMGFDSTQLITLIMVVNLTAAVGAFLFGFLQDRFGSVRSLAGGIVIWVLAILVTMVATQSWHVWLAANLMGLAMGSTQAGGRALIGRLTPRGRNAEFFGLWGLASRAAAIIGPLAYGVVNRFSSGDHRLALTSTLVFFVIGLLLLLTVSEARGVSAGRKGSL